jgi:hypothetical protein
MSNFINQAKDLFELQQLEIAIKTELDLECQILVNSVDIPIDTLAVNIEFDSKGRTRIASLMFIPLENSNIETLKLLQFFCETSICVESQPIRANVAEFLSAINFKIPLGTFCFDPQNRVTFKYIYALGKFTAIESDEFLESFLFWVFTLDSMSVLIEEVAEGERSLESAIQLLEE